jgi:N-acetylglucosamine-6-phosphate deacetylase
VSGHPVESSPILVRGGDVLAAGRLEPGADLLAEDGRILAIGRGFPEGRGTRVVDARGRWVLPGLIDIHTHGIGDVAIDTGSAREYARLHAQNGVTACLATLALSAEADAARMREILRETEDFRLAPNIVGFRPEILYLVDASAGPSSSLARPDPAITESLWEASRGLIKVWDVSPEIEGALPFIAWCAEHGVVASMAHSAAGIEVLRPAVDAGLSLVTHFYDLFAMPREVDEGVYPAGVTDYINVEDRLTVEIIPDGVHVHPLLVEQTLRCKGAGRVAFITDSLRGSGKPPGTYEGIIAGQPVEVTADRGIRRKSDGILSGSALTQLVSLRNAVTRFGRSLPEASRLCSATPARVLGLRRKGALAAGMDADVIVLDRDLRLQATIAGGAVLHEA